MDTYVSSFVAVFIMAIMAAVVLFVTTIEGDKTDKESATKEESKQDIVEHKLEDGTTIIIMEKSNGELEVIELE